MVVLSFSAPLQWIKIKLIVIYEVNISLDVINILHNNMKVNIITNIKWNILCKKYCIETPPRKKSHVSRHKQDTKS